MTALPSEGIGHPARLPEVKAAFQKKGRKSAVDPAAGYPEEGINR